MIGGTTLKMNCPTASVGRGLCAAPSLALGLVLGCAMVQAAPALAEPGHTVVELFTSEGCSSCPPAEAMLGKLAQRSDVIALAFHVDYWDYIGWQDRFELKEATARQREYARTLHLPTVYTPQLVINGIRDRVGGGDPSQVVPAEAPPADFPIAIAVKGDQLIVDVGARMNTGSASTTHPSADVLLLSYLPEAVSKPNRGENSGHELHDFNIVRSIRTLGVWDGAAKSYRAPLSSLPSDATQVAVLVQLANQGPIVGAVAQSVH
jgi:hypothetical protein